MAIEPRFGLEHVFELAREKDGGFTPVIFIEMLDRLPRLRRDEFPIDNEQFENLKFRVQVWKTGAIELSSSEERSTEIGKSRDDGLDLGY